MPNFETADNQINQLNENLKELNKEDALLVKEEFKILTKAILPQLMNKIEIASGEVLETSDGQKEMDRLLDEYSERQRYLENLKQYLVQGDIVAFKAAREHRIDTELAARGFHSFVGEDRGLEKQTKWN